MTTQRQTTQTQTVHALDGIEISPDMEAMLARMESRKGDPSKMTPEEREDYVVAMCRALRLNPLTRPVQFINLSGKEVLYVTRTATDQLAAMHSLNRKTVVQPHIADIAGTKVAMCVVEVSLPNGRSETATATLGIADPVNLYMKLESKAKRRATLSILGLGLLAEDETETIPGARRADEPRTPTPRDGMPAARPSLPPGIEADNARRADRNAAARVDAETLRAAAPEVNADAEDPAVAVEQEMSVAEMPDALYEFHQQVARIELPGESPMLWIRSRTYLATLPAPDREAAWKALCKRGEEVGKMKAAKVWLRKAIAEEDARRETSGKSDHQAA